MKNKMIICCTVLWPLGRFYRNESVTQSLWSDFLPDQHLKRLTSANQQIVRNNCVFLRQSQMKCKYFQQHHIKSCHFLRRTAWGGYEIGEGSRRRARTHWRLRSRERERVASSIRCISWHDGCSINLTHWICGLCCVVAPMLSSSKYYM